MVLADSRQALAQLSDTLVCYLFYSCLSAPLLHKRLIQYKNSGRRRCLCSLSRNTTEPDGIVGAAASLASDDATFIAGPTLAGDPSRLAEL